MVDYGSELANILVAFSLLGVMALGLAWVMVGEYKRSRKDREALNDQEVSDGA